MYYNDYSNLANNRAKKI